MITAICKPVAVDLLIGRTTQEQSTVSTVEVELGKIIIPGGTIGKNGLVRVVALWRTTGANHSATMRIKFGGNTIKQQIHTSGNQQYDNVPAYVWNQNAINAQDSSLLGAQLHNTNNVVGSWAVDTALDVDVTFTGLVANANRTLYFRAGIVEVFRNDE